MQSGWGFKNINRSPELLKLKYAAEKEPTIFGSLFFAESVWRQMSSNTETMKYGTADSIQGCSS
jgi:hypothetical protein